MVRDKSPRSPGRGPTQKTARTIEAAVYRRIRALRCDLIVGRHSPDASSEAHEKFPEPFGNGSATPDWSLISLPYSVPAGRAPYEGFRSESATFEPCVVACHGQIQEDEAHRGPQASQVLVIARDVRAWLGSLPLGPK